MKEEFLSQATRGTPAVAGAAASAYTLNEWVMIATGLYIVIQVLYLVRKWWREEADWRKDKQ
jgi:hypothetical protein